MEFEFAPNDPLFQLATVLVFGIVVGELVALIRLPKVTGWICAGIILRTFEANHRSLTGLTTGAVSDFAP